MAERTNLDSSLEDSSLESKINFLLQPLGIRVFNRNNGEDCERSLFFPWTLVDSRQKFVSCIFKGRTLFDRALVEKSVEDVWLRISKDISVFRVFCVPCLEILDSRQTSRRIDVDYSHYVRMENPYLGCRSLEEALVRRDLVFVDGEKKKEESKKRVFEHGHEVRDRQSLW